MGPYFPVIGVWEVFSGSFTAPAGTDFLTIQFTATTGADPASTCLMHVDNVVVAQDVVPVEDSTWGAVKALFQ